MKRPFNCMYQFIALCTLSALTAFVPAKAQTVGGCPCNPDFISASDVNGDGIGPTVADYVYLTRVLLGDSLSNLPPDSLPPLEFDGYQNSFLPCRPSIGDVLAYARYFMFGLPAVPAINCDDLSEPLKSELELVTSGPDDIFSVSNRSYTVKLRNTAASPVYLWALTVPFELDIKLNNLSQFSFTIDSASGSSGLSQSVRVIDSNYVSLTFLPDSLSPFTPLAFAPGQEIDLFSYSIEFIAPTRTLITPGVRISDPTNAPYIVTSPTVNGATRTEILTMSTESCCGPLGDADGNGRFSIADVTTNIQYIFANGPAPACTEGADIDNSGSINIADVTTAISYIFGEAPILTCGSCWFYPFVNNALTDSRGDINLNGISFEISDWVLFRSFLERGDSAFPANLIEQHLQTDIDYNCIGGTVGDFVLVGRVVLGGLIPPIGPINLPHFSTTANFSFADSVLSVDQNVRAVLAIFPGETTFQNLSANLSIGSATANGYTTAFLHESLAQGPVTATGALFKASHPPLSVESADSLGVMYNSLLDLSNANLR